MAPKVSSNRRFSKVQSDNISFKSKRRRKLHVECLPTYSHIASLAAEKPNKQNNSFEAYKPYKSPKHRWKLNTKSESDEQSISGENCMKTARRHGPQRIQLKCSSHQQQTHEKCNQRDDKNGRDDNGHHTIKPKSSCHVDCLRRQSHNFPVVPTGKTQNSTRRDFINCRKLREWTTPSSVRKLLPIFVLVNMLPFLCAGECLEALFACISHLVDVVATSIIYL